MLINSVVSETPLPAWGAEIDSIARLLNPGGRYRGSAHRMVFALGYVTGMMQSGQPARALALLEQNLNEARSAGVYRRVRGLMHLITLAAKQ